MHGKQLSGSSSIMQTRNWRGLAGRCCLHWKNAAPADIPQAKEHPEDLASPYEDRASESSIQELQDSSRVEQFDLQELCDS